MWGPLKSINIICKWYKMKKCMCEKKKSSINNLRRKVKNIKLLPVIERKSNTSLPVFRYDEHNEILEEMARKALEILDE